MISKIGKAIRQIRERWCACLLRVLLNSFDCWPANEFMHFGSFIAVHFLQREKDYIHLFEAFMLMYSVYWICVCMCCFSVLFLMSLSSNINPKP